MIARKVMHAKEPDTTLALPIELRADLKPLRVRPGTGPLAIVLIGLGGLQAVAFTARDHSILLTGALLVCGLVAFPAIYLACQTYYRHVRIRLDERGLTLLTPLGKRNPTASGPVTRIIRTEVSYGRLTTQHWPIWLFVNGTGRAVMRVSINAWDPVELERLRASLGVPLESRPTTLTLSRLRAEFPGAATWYQAHGAVSVVAVLIVITLIVMAVEGKL